MQSGRAAFVNLLMMMGGETLFDAGNVCLVVCILKGLTFGQSAPIVSIHCPMALDDENGCVVCGVRRAEIGSPLVLRLGAWNESAWNEHAGSS